MLVLGRVLVLAPSTLIYPLSVRHANVQTCKIASMLFLKFVHVCTYKVGMPKTNSFDHFHTYEVPTSMICFTLC